MSQPWKCDQLLPPNQFARLLRQAIFDCCKWHTHVEDQPVLCPFALVLSDEAWRQAARLAEALSWEALAAENELLRRPELWGLLGLPPDLCRCLHRALAVSPTMGGARIMRFDFHWTSEGWRISEGNIDAAGGLLEASGVTRILAECYPQHGSVGDPAKSLSAAIRRLVGAGGKTALMHLTVYPEDRQAMLYLARRLQEEGVRPILLSPSQVRWVNGRAEAVSDGYTGPLDLVFRFFPGEWLPLLGPDAGWEGYLAGGQTICCNPGQAILTQTKRFPLVWDQLAAPLPTWRALLPETHPADSKTDWAERGWVVKPALGHEGADVAIAGVTESGELERIQRAGANAPNAWLRQRRFETLPLSTPEGPMYPCLGVYVVDGQAAGAYGRMGRQPLIDSRSREVVVLVEPPAAEDRPRLRGETVGAPPPIPGRPEIYDRWAPPEGLWSLWVRPNLFAQMTDCEVPGKDDGPDPWLRLAADWADAQRERTALLVDLPGEESVWWGLALARKGYRPVPLYEVCTGPHEAIDQGPILHALCVGAEFLGSLRLPADAPPAFLTDARRMNAAVVRPGAFDNRWRLSPFDFPSAAFLTRHGLRRALLLVRGVEPPQEDLVRVLHDWQGAGVSAAVLDVAAASRPRPLPAALPRPSVPADGFGITR